MGHDLQGVVSLFVPVLYGKDTDMPIQKRKAGKMVSENPIMSSSILACISQWGTFSVRECR